jgi:hypothetical protein
MLNLPKSPLPLCALFGGLFSYVSALAGPTIAFKQRKNISLAIVFSLGDSLALDIARHATYC